MVSFAFKTTLCLSGRYENQVRKLLAVHQSTFIFFDNDKPNLFG